MNNTVLSGRFATPPKRVGHDKGIRFILNTRHSSPSQDSRFRTTPIACGVFDATPEQREILLSKKHRNFRAEISGRLEQIVSQKPGERRTSRLEVIVNQNGLVLQKVR